MKVDDLELKKIKDPSEIPVIVHGTYHKHWSSIKDNGLKKMDRNHIHMATGKFGDAGVISGEYNMKISLLSSYSLPYRDATYSGVVNLYRR